MQIWPTNDILSDPSITLAGNLDVSTLRLDMEDGRTRQRRRFSVDRLVLNVDWIFTDQELRIFKAFLKYKLNEGTDQFFFPLSLGGGPISYVVRFIQGKTAINYVDVGYWNVTAQLETMLQNLFCYPSIFSFITNQGTFVDLTSYFNLVVASPGAATAWRLVSDACSGSIVYATGTIDDTGRMIPGDYLAGPGVGDGGSDVTGFNSSDCRFWSFTEDDFGVYLQVNCSGVWPFNPCIGYDLPTVPTVTFAGMSNDPRNSSLIPPNGTYDAHLLAPDHWQALHSIGNGGGTVFIPDPITWQLDIIRVDLTARFLITFYPVDGTSSPDYGIGGAYSLGQRRGVLGYNRNSTTTGGSGSPGAFRDGTILIN